jgi:hypothetical protein
MKIRYGKNSWYGERRSLTAFQGLIVVLVLIAIALVLSHFGIKI